MKLEDHVNAFFECNPDLYTLENLKIVTEVNIRIDQFAHFPNSELLSRHRKFLHHWEGVEYFDLLYGEIGRKAAEHHILEDCDHIPFAIQYYTGQVDQWGNKK